MTDPGRIKLLKGVRLFSDLTAEELAGIADRLSIRAFKKNEVILYEEDFNKYMYAILHGKVKIVQTTEDGKEIIIGMHQAGDSFGEISLIDGQGTTASVIAREDSMIAIITRQSFYSILHAQPKVLESVLKMLCSRIRENVDRIQLLTFNNASERMKRLLVKLARQHGEKTDSGVMLNVKLTHQDMANMSGLTRETVTRVIDQWQKDGVLSVAQGRRLVVDQGLLEEL
jgi:CRP/FNR family transcriptional regulator